MFLWRSLCPLNVAMNTGGLLDDLMILSSFLIRAHAHAPLLHHSMLLCHGRCDATICHPSTFHCSHREGVSNCPAQFLSILRIVTTLLFIGSSLGNTSCQIIIFQQPRFPFQKITFLGNRSRDVAIIWPGHFETLASCTTSWCIRFPLLHHSLSQWTHHPGTRSSGRSCC